MTKPRLVVVSGGFAYPTGDALELVRKAGGFSRLTETVRKSVKFKTVTVGDDCSDMPFESQAVYLERGEIAIVDPKGKG